VFQSFKKKVPPVMVVMAAGERAIYAESRPKHEKFPGIVTRRTGRENAQLLNFPSRLRRKMMKENQGKI
jgi:hypothetical protein